MLLLNIFINNIQKSKKKLAGTIGFEEKNNALNMWIQSEQKCVIFSKKFKQQCKSLQLFLVKDNLYHIRNRFDDEKTLFDSIYPVFLPRPLLTNLIILEAQRPIQKLIPSEIIKCNTEVLPNVNNNFNENSLNESLRNVNEHKYVQRSKRTTLMQKSN